MANVHHVTAWAGRTKYKAAWFLLSSFVFRVSGLNLQPISAKYGLLSWLKPSDEIGL